MVDSTETGNIVLSDDPPNIVLVRAKGQAGSLARSIYVYRFRSEWVMTTDLSEPPCESAVWMVPANQNNFERQS